MKKNLSQIVVCFFAVVLACCFSTGAFAKVTSEMLKDIDLDDAPKDIKLSPDGLTAYILCEKSILVFSKPENKVTDTIPLSNYSARFFCFIKVINRMT